MRSTVAHAKLTEPKQALIPSELGFNQVLIKQFDILLIAYFIIQYYIKLF